MNDRYVSEFKPGRYFNGPHLHTHNTAGDRLTKMIFPKGSTEIKESADLEREDTDVDPELC